MTPVSARHESLARKIHRIFQNGLNIDRDAVQYMDSTLSGHAPEILEAVLRDPFDCERDPLIELLYFPDEATQVQLEDFLESSAFTKEDEKSVLKALLSSPGETLFRFPGENTCWKVKTPRSGASAFLGRLRIAGNPDPALVSVIDLRVPQADRRLCKVRIRNTPLVTSRGTIDGLADFFDKTDPGRQHFFEQLGFLLNLLSESEMKAELRDVLKDRKRLLMRQLQQAARQETLYRERAVETLMMQGARLPHLDRQAIMKQIVMIDEISLAIFDETVYVENFSGY